MAKRFTSTEIWEEDWFLEMPNEYKLFWYYMLSNCDHAGLYKVNLRSFCGLNEVKLSSKTALTYFNTGKQRIREISETIWFVEDFFNFQYGETFNLNNRLHESILKLWQKQKIELSSIRGLKDLKDRVKDKDKDKDVFLKDKGAGKENFLNKNKNGTQPINFKAQGENLYAERIARHQAKIDESRGENNLQSD